jgi:hypothetical protein
MWYYFTQAVLWLVRKDLGLAALLAIGTWFALTKLWLLSEPGTAIYKAIATLARFSWWLGSYLNQLHPFKPSEKALLNQVGELLVFLAFWWAVVHFVRESKREQLRENRSG